MWLLLLVGCAPTLPDDTPYVTDPRVLAVRLDPPEVEAGDAVRLQALYADASGALATGAVDWSFCTVPKPLAELGPVAPDCLDPASEDLAALGSGLDVQGPTPGNACSLFGPDPPPPQEGEPAGRPADPDVTGGFYQPALGFPDDGDPTLASVRLRCGLANVTQETYVAWNQAYVSNRNPVIAALDLERDGEFVTVPEDGTGTPPSVAAGEAVTLAVSWPDCTDPCDGAETYVVYEPDTKVLVSRREAISATWFATAGTFDVARSGRDGDDPATSVTNGWVAPSEPGTVWLSVVLRDERGGVAFAGYRVTVDP